MADIPLRSLSSSHRVHVHLARRRPQDYFSPNSWPLQPHSTSGTLFAPPGQPPPAALGSGRLHDGEIWAAPRSWIETVYPNLTYFNEVDRGGHFAAWEEPELFSTAVRAPFSSLR
jgi:hypothetical protein